VKTVFLQRHAKSSWRNKELPDIDRPLKAKGINDAYAAAEFIKSKGLHPDHILSSPANRALHTAIIMARIIEFPFQRLEIHPHLYHGNSEAIVDVIKVTNSEYDSIMLVGHDPILTNFFNWMTGAPIEKIPTASVLSIQFEISNWQQLNKGTGTLKIEFNP